jgi:hypothetical protein
MTDKTKQPQCAALAHIRDMPIHYAVDRFACGFLEATAMIREGGPFITLVEHERLFGDALKALRLALDLLQTYDPDDTLGLKKHTQEGLKNETA